MADKSNKQNELLMNISRRGRISRREFLTLLSTGGIAAILAACYPRVSKIDTMAASTPTKKSLITSPTTFTPIISTPPPTNTVITPPPQKSISKRIEDRLFPSIFMAWGVAKNLNMSWEKNVAKYDLVITNEWQFELAWDSNYPGQGVSFLPENLETARTIRKNILVNNPNTILLPEVRYRDADSNWLPEDAPDWERDSRGGRVPGWGNYYMLDWHKPSARARVVDQAKAFVESGIFDGIMFDWWEDSDPDRIKMLEDVRSAIGEEKLIIVNSNQRLAPKSAPYVNGLYMEAAFWSNELQTSGPPSTPADWQIISNTLLWAESNLRGPHINALETWYVNTPNELNRLRATTTLALTHSDGYALFANNNHDHDWYPFWDHKELGKPIAKFTKRPDGAIQREFDGGTVIYNPMGNAAVTVKFSQSRLSVASGQTGLTFSLAAMDGDLYLQTI